MIGRLTGRVVGESPDGTVVIDVQGVGYEVLCPLGSIGRAARDEGRVVLHVVTHVREDAITLFGFASDADRAAFRLLTSVAGVGPRTAVAVLGSLPLPELAAAVAKGDIRTLQGVPGVGRKIAERLSLELKDKLPLTSVSGSSGVAPLAPMPVAPQGPVGPLGPLVATLLKLGFRPAEAERAAAEMAPRAHEPLDALVRDALKLLVR